MRKPTIKLLLVAMILLTIPSPSFAQQRLRFDGVPVRGNMMTVVNRLRHRGWTLTEAADYAATLDGRWAGMDGVTVTVFKDNGGKGVAGVGVLVPCDLSWTDIHEKWDAVISDVSFAWGNPTLYDESFSGGSPENDAERLLALQAGRCRDVARWVSAGGTIEAVPAFISYTYCILVRYAITTIK